MSARAATAVPGPAPVAIPGPTPWQMLLGAPGILRDPLGYLQRAVAEHGPVVSFPTRGRPAVLVDGPAAVRRVLQDNHRAYTKDTMQYTALAMVTGQGLLTSDGATWLAHRRAIQPAFHRGTLSHVAEQSLRAAFRAGEAFDAAAGAPVDTDAVLMRATLDVVGSTLFGSDLVGGGEADGDRLVAAVHDALGAVIARATRPWTAPPGLPTPAARRLHRALNELDLAAERMIARRRATPGDSDVLGLLLAAGADAMSPQELRDELVTLVIAGHETVASSLTWTLRLLAENPEAQQKVHTELDAVLGAGGRAPSWVDVRDLRVTRAAVDEGLRLFPPAWVITRRAVDSDVLAGHPIAPGTLIITSPWLQHRNPSAWPDPERFDLERWLAGPSRPHREAYLPFGAGPRLCIGRDFAIVESVLVLAELLRSRQVSVTGPRPGVAALVTLRPRGGSWLRFEPRA